MKYSLTSCLLLLLVCLINCTEDEILSTSYLPADLEVETFSVSNPKVPTLNNVTINGSKVTLEFTNHAAPKKPEGGFELMLNGKRTITTITPRLHSTEKNLTMSFSLDNPNNYYYQIYARWNSGYVSSEKFYPGQASNTPSTPDETPTDSPSNGSEDDNGESNIAGLPELKLLRRYEFEDNIGRNVTQSQDGLQVHHLGNQGGKVVSLDGVGAYHFTTVADRARNHRHELVPRSLPTPHFNKGFISTWNEEYVYEMRLRLSENFEIGSGYTSIFEAKNDYDINRSPSLALRVQGDHYQIKLYYSTTKTTNKGGEGGPETFLDANGNKLRPGIDFNKTTKTGHGYPGIENDKGKWVKWTVHAKWAYDHSGFLKIYKDGKLFYSYKGPTSFKDDKAPYVKFGLYNSYWKNGKDIGADRQESYVDYFRVYTTK